MAKGKNLTSFGILRKDFELEESTIKSWDKSQILQLGQWLKHKHTLEQFEESKDSILLGNNEYHSSKQLQHSFIFLFTYHLRVISSRYWTQKRVNHWRHEAF